MGLLFCLKVRVIGRFSGFCIVFLSLFLRVLAGCVHGLVPTRILLRGFKTVLSLRLGFV